MEFTIVMNESEVLITTFIGPAIASGYYLLKQYLKSKKWD